MIRSLSSSRQSVGQGARDDRRRDRRGAGGSRASSAANLSRSLQEINNHKGGSAAARNGAGGRDNRPERPGMFRQLSTHFLSGTVQLVRRNSFTGLASDESGSGSGGVLRNRGRGGLNLGAKSDRGLGRHGRRRSTSFDSAEEGRKYRVPSSERDLLEVRIQERDGHIKALEQDLRRQKEDLRVARDEDARLRRLKLHEDYVRKLWVYRLKREHKAMLARVKIYKRDMHDRDSLHGYAELIKGAAPTSTDSTYVMRLQSQLGKATNKMEAMEGQMDMVRQTCDEVMASLNDEINDVIEEKCKVEVELRDQIAQLEQEKTRMEKKYAAQMQKEEARCVLLKAKEEEKDSNDSARDSPVRKRKAKKSKEEQIIDLRKELEQLADEKEEGERKLRYSIRKKKEEITRIQKMNELGDNSVKRLEANLGSEQLE